MTKNRLLSKKSLSVMAAMGFASLLLLTQENNEQGEGFTTAVVEDASIIATANNNDSPAVAVPFNELSPALIAIDNEFVLFQGIKDVLDNLILSADSTDKSTIMALAQSWCKDQDLSEAGCLEFEALLSRYIDYKLAMVSFEADDNAGLVAISDSMAYIRERIEALRALRYQWFSEEEVLALFGEEQAVDDQALARREIAMDASLSRDEKLALIAQHVEQLPEEQRAPLQPTLDMQALDSIKNQYQDRQLRLLEVETKFGYEAAQRLEKTWQKQEDFQRKIDDIAEQYAALAAEEGDALRTQQTQFLEQHFTGNQIRRARAILKSYSTSTNS